MSEGEGNSEGEPTPQQPQQKQPSTKLELLESDVTAHGEVHATISELGERDIRRGTSMYHHALDMVTIVEGPTTHRVDVDEITYWYTPTEF